MRDCRALVCRAVPRFMNGEILLDIMRYWEATVKQQADQMRAFFWPEAVINWHNTNERFTAEEFIQANCAYPCDWDGTVERVEKVPDGLVTVVRVFSPGRDESCHAVSFFRLREDKIVAVDEYWGDDGAAPDWRRKLGIGTPIR